jgi:hypothetical protein
MKPSTKFKGAWVNNKNHFFFKDAFEKDGKWLVPFVFYNGGKWKEDNMLFDISEKKNYLKYC